MTSRKSEYRFTSATSRIESPVRCYASDWKLEMAPKLMRRNAYTSRHDCFENSPAPNFRGHVQLHELNGGLSDELTADRSFHAISNSSNVISQTLFADRSLPSPPAPSLSLLLLDFQRFEGLKMTMRHRAKYTIADSKLRLFTRVACDGGGRMRGGGGRGNTRGRLAETLREMAASSRLTIGAPSACFVPYGVFTHRSAARPTRTWPSTTLSRNVTWKHSRDTGGLAARERQRERRRRETRPRE